MAGAYPTSSREDDYRGESDHGTLERACEIMADKIRMKGVLRHHNKQKAADKKMDGILAKHRITETKY